MAQLVTLDLVKSGEANTDDLLKLNALLDMRDAIHSRAHLENKK